MTNRNTPDIAEPHAHKYQSDAWQAFTVAELAMWSHLLRKRAEMRTSPDAAVKDLEDAAVYESLMHAKIALEKSEGGAA